MKHKRHDASNKTYITIESAQERIVSVDPDGDAVLTMEDAIKLLFREPAKKSYIPALKGSCPAFEYWVDRLQTGERLPRGKYFNSCDFLRSLRLNRKIK
ncbi:hypothetical protein B9P23_23025 [Salmonella enterica]|nr:hypothetical protein [Salmonella enterica]ECI0375918.1 hypothetical protein [Salmonella enterica subsp. enterica]EDK3325461.1 hypothetical protein [Salmonella enterica subsp. enterica serovar Enteritidis]EFA1230379.1 hypothetical protein [Escherichia coli]EGI5506583.1 hypothetical protein [Salmonella enterica subsp. enterica serovar 47:z4,z23:-]EGI6181592.1 hypothetical protein [Salmonella enterica subsp. houtenae serovar 51:z4,z23:-]